MKTKTVVYFSLVSMTVLSSAILVGCGNKTAESRNAPKMEVHDLKEYEVGTSSLADDNRQTLKINTIFFWKDPMLASDVALVKTAARKVQIIQDQLRPVNEESDNIDSEIELALGQITAVVTDEEDPLRTGIDDLDDVVSRWAKLPLEDAQTDEQKTKFQKLRTEIDAKMQALWDLIPSQTPAVKTAITDLTSAYSRRMVSARVKLKNKPLDTQLTEAVVSISNATDGFATSSELTVDFNQGPIPSVSLAKWPASTSSFKSEDGTLYAVNYVKKGGKLTFSVSAGPDEIYHFRLVRSRTDRVGKIYYQGEVDKMVGGRRVRLGVAKFANDK